MVDDKCSVWGEIVKENIGWKAVEELKSKSD